MRLALRAGRVAAAVALAAALGGAAAEPAPALRACLDADDPPFSQADTPAVAAHGLHLDLARALAARLGRPLQPVWVEVPNRGGLSKALRTQLLAGRCELWFGLPLEPALRAELAGLGLQLSPAYLGLGYHWLAGPGQPAPTAEQVARARRIGVVSATPADLHLHRRQLPRLPHGDADALLAGLHAGTLDLALIWSPALSRPAARGLASSRVDLGDEASLRVGLGLALRAQDRALAEVLAPALDALRADGTLEALRRAHRLPDTPLPPSVPEPTPDR